MEEILLHDKSNAYEQKRKARIAENEAKLRALGIQRKVTSEKCSAGSIKNNKRKEKEKANLCREADLCSDGEDEYDPLNFEVRKKASQSNIQHRVRYIPPRSMKNFPNVAKRLSFQKPDISDTNQQESLTEQRPFAYDDQQEVGVSESRKKKGKQMTMADLILQKKVSFGANEVVTHHLDQTPLTSLRENVSSKGEDISTRSIDSRRLHTCNDSLEMNISESNTEDEDLQFGFEEEAEHSEDDSSEQVDLTSRDLELAAIMKEKTRGPTMLHHVHMRPIEKRKAIILNEFGQPIGPVSEEGNTVAEFSRFLGTIARDYDYAPIVFESWRKVPNKEKMWEYVLMKYNVPKEGKEWVMKTIGAAWRVYKCRFKRKHFSQYEDDRDRWENRSKRVPETDFLKLLATWKKKSEKVRCSRNRECRLAQKNMHTVGPKSFAVMREEMKNEHPNKEAPSLAELFERTRKRKEGKTYKESYEDTAQKIEAMKNFSPLDDETGQTDAFLSVMGKDRDGRRRLYGRGVCNRKLKKLSSTTTTSYVVPREVLESMKASLFEELQKDMNSEMTRVEQMRREMEEEHEKKKAELEEMRRNIDNEREIMTEQIMRKIIGKLPSDVRQYLCRE